MKAGVAALRPYHFAPRAARKVPQSNEARQQLDQEPIDLPEAVNYPQRGIGSAISECSAQPWVVGTAAITAPTTVDAATLQAQVMLAQAAGINRETGTPGSAGPKGDGVVQRGGQPNAGELLIGVVIVAILACAGIVVPSARRRARARIPSR